MEAVAAAILCAGAPVAALGQTTEPSPAPSATPIAAPIDDTHPDTGDFDASKLTPEQQQALRLAVIKTSQNPVGNITVVPFQNNFNYGFGPYTRLQYNLNVQPVVPIMLSQNMNLIARTIIPVVKPTVVRSANGLRVAVRMPVDVRAQRRSGAVILCAKN